MGKKRQRKSDSDSEVDESRIWEQLKRITRKLKKRKHRSAEKRRHRRYESDSSAESEIESARYLSDSQNSDVGVGVIEGYPSGGGTSTNGDDGTLPAPQENAVRDQARDILQATPSRDTPAEEESLTQIEGTLEASILEAMGKRVIEERELGPAIYKDLAVRWEDILKNGLPKEERDTLIRKYPPPSNCMVIDAPKLNVEIKVSLPEAMVKRDSRLIEKQQKITACLALLGQCTKDVITDKSEKVTLVQSLSDAGRLLADLQRDESRTRKSLILTNICASQRDTLQSAISDEWLFGKNLGERMKDAKSIQQSSKELSRNQSSKTPRDSKNFKGPLRYQQRKTTPKGGPKSGFPKQKGWGHPNRNRHRNNAPNNPPNKQSFQQKKH